MREHRTHALHDGSGQTIYFALEGAPSTASFRSTYVLLALCLETLQPGSMLVLPREQTLFQRLQTLQPGSMLV
eukprot:scaffold7555_cov1062-Prasinococcus_capsulatus_cf.AAC.1